MESEDRLRLVAAEAKLTIDAPIRLPSDSNEVWKMGELVLRICWWSTDRTRLQREALILEHLPDDVPHARLADSGVVDNLSWTLTRWVPGEMLSQGWADLDPTKRRAVAEQLGHALRALHAWEPSPEVRAALAFRPAPPDASAVIGADLNPLPVGRALRLVEPAMHLENIDPQLVAQLGEQLERLRHLDPLTDRTAGAVVHGDANLNNVVWDGARLALLDFEWARLGPADLELQPLLPEDGALVRLLVTAYPALVAHSQIVDRLWLYDLSATLRDLLVKAPLPASDDLPPWHPKRRLPMVLAGPGYIEALLSER